MRRDSGRFTLAAVSLVCILLLAACSNNSRITLRYITVTPTTGSTSVNAQFQFTAQAFYSDGSIKSGLGIVTWSSSNTAVATVDQTGLATGVGPGTTTIMVSAAGTTAVTATLTVNQLKSIAITPANPTVQVPSTEQFDAMGTFSDGSTSDITTMAAWSSSDMTVATIGASTGLATTLKQGTTTITASLFGVNQTTLLTVTAGPVSLSIAPAGPTIAIGNTAAFVATENWSDGTTLHVPSGTVSWSSGTTATASILANATTSSNATALGLTAGTSTITATEGTLTPGTTTLTVATGSSHFAYVSNNSDGNIQWYSVTASTATLTSKGLFPPTGTLASSPTQTVIHPNGKFLYYTGINSNVYVATIDPATGTPTDTGFTPLLAGAANTNFMVIDPFGRFLYVSDDGGLGSTTGTITAFTIDQSTGATAGQLTPVTLSPSHFTTNLSAPKCLIIDRTGSYLYATNNAASTISAYTIDPTTGALTPFTTNPTIPTGTGPNLGALDPTGTYLYTANFNSVSGGNSVSAYSIGSGGALTHLGDTSIATAISLGNLVVDPSATHLYVLDNGGTDGQIFGFNIGTGGVIGSSIGAAVPTGSTPIGAIVIDPTGSFLAVENNFDNDISLYTIKTGGVLTSAGTAVTGAGPLFVTLYNAP